MKRRKKTRGRLPRSWACIWKGHLLIRRDGECIRPESVATPSIEMLEQFRAAADGLVKIVTVAPEIPGALQLIARAVADGLVVAVGHTDADYDQARAAY